MTALASEYVLISKTGALDAGGGGGGGGVTMELLIMVVVIGVDIEVVVMGVDIEVVIGVLIVDMVVMVNMLLLIIVLVLVLMLIIDDEAMFIPAVTTYCVAEELMTGVATPVLIPAIGQTESWHWHMQEGQGGRAPSMPGMP